MRTGRMRTGGTYLARVAARATVATLAPPPVLFATGVSLRDLDPPATLFAFGRRPDIVTLPVSDTQPTAPPVAGRPEVARQVESSGLVDQSQRPATAPPVQPGAPGQPLPLTPPHLTSAPEEASSPPEPSDPPASLRAMPEADATGSVAAAPTARTRSQGARDPMAATVAPLPEITPARTTQSGAMQQADIVPAVESASSGSLQVTSGTAGAPTESATPRSAGGEAPPGLVAMERAAERWQAHIGTPPSSTAHPQSPTVFRPAASVPAPSPIVPPPLRIAPPPPRNAAARGTGVTIGTLEVRVAAPPPATAPAVRRVPATAPTPLARGFRAFGLAQS